jgi:hypothetical protein
VLGEPRRQWRGEYDAILGSIPKTRSRTTPAFAAVRLSEDAPLGRISPPPTGPVKGWPYYRCIELAARALASPDGYGGIVLDPSRTYSVIEFGVAQGNGFQLLLHCRDVCLRKFGLSNKLLALGFDSFEGMPAPRAGDDALLWRSGDLPGDMASLQRHLESRFADFRLVKGYFSESLPREGTFLREHPPVFVSIDCDYSTMDVLDYLLPEIACHGCLFYFDDVSINFCSDRSGELKAIREVNDGRYGDHIQLVEYPLWIETGEMRHYRQIYRLFNLEVAEKQQRDVRSARPLKQAPRGRQLSPL